MDERLRDIIVSVGGTIKIPIGMEGDPAPTIYWYRAGVPFTPGGNSYLETDRYTTTLVTKHATLRDAGEYRVVAKNEWGTSSATVHVKVLGKSSAGDLVEARLTTLLCFAIATLNFICVKITEIYTNLI